MSNWNLLYNQTVTQAAPPPPLPVSPWGPTNPKSPPLQQTFQLVISGSAGNVSGTAQLVVSNDEGPDPSLYNWVPYGDPLVAASTYLVAQAQTSMNQGWRHFGAYLTAISGTNAAATLKMNA